MMKSRNQLVGTAVLILCALVGTSCASDAPQILEASPGKKTHLSWTPDGDALAFLVTSKTETRLQVHSRKDRKTTDLSPANVFAWAPDGKSLAFSRFEEGQERIVLRPWPDGPERTLANGSQPAFANNGGSLVFLRDGHVQQVVLGGGPERMLTERPKINTALSPVPQGVFFTGDGMLWFVERGQPPKLILRNEGMGSSTSGLEYFVDLAASPNGSKVLLISSGGQDAKGRSSSLILLNADGSGKKLIGDGQHPCWSADSSLFVFSSNGDLHLYSLADGSTRQLTQKRAANHSWPALSPDGKTLAFVATLADTTGDGKIDWRDQPGVFVMKISLTAP